MQWLVENHPTKPANAVWADALVLKLKEADFFGEIALLSGKPRQATVKAVGPVSVLVMSRDAFTRLCGPLFEILRRNMATYSTLELPDEPAPQGAGEEEDPVGDTQDDEGGEEEDVAMPADYKGRQRGRRNNVFVESAKVEDGWVPPFYEKTADEKARLEGYISKTFLLSFLDVKVSRRRKPALPNQRPARCGVTCEPPRPHVCGGGGALGRHVTRWSMRLRRRITPRTTRSSGRHAPAARAPQCRSAAAMPRHALLSALLVGAQGEDGDYYYILDSGHTEVWLSKPPGTPEVKVFEYSVGGAFGELALLHGEPRQATVRATEDCTTWALDRDTFRKIMMSTGKSEINQRLEFISKVCSPAEHAPAARGGALRAGRAQVPLLEECSLNERFKIAEAMEVRQFADGEVIVQEGDVGNEFFIINAGQCNCYKRTLKF